MPAPANDLIANAILLTGTSGVEGPVTIDDATHTDTEDTSGTDDVFQSVWWKWVAPSTGRLRLSTFGSVATDGNGDGDPDTPGPSGNLDTRLQLWHGTTPGSLTSVAYSDDTNTDPVHDYFGWTSWLLYDVTAGETYYIQAGTFWTPYTGTLLLTWELGSLSAPANNDIAGALTIPGGSTRTGYSGYYPVDNCTTETGETSISGATHDSGMQKTMWWKWVADGSGTVTIKLNSVVSKDAASGYLGGPNLDVEAVAYEEGSSPGFANFTERGYTGFYFSSLTFTATYGKTYYIAVGAKDGTENGDVVIRWALPTREIHIGSSGEAEAATDCATVVFNWDRADRKAAHSPTAGQLKLPMPDWEEGMLLVAWVGSEINNLSAPGGWTSLFDVQWGTRPTSVSSNPGATPFAFTHSYMSCWYKIAEAGDPAPGTDGIVITGFTGSPTPSGGGAIASYICYETENFTQVDFPDPPMVYSGVDAHDPRLIPSPGSGEQTTASYPAVSAPWVGNHIYFALAQIYGYEYASPLPMGNSINDPAQPDDSVILRGVVGPDAGDTFPGGDHTFRYDGCYYWLWSSGDSVYDDLGLNGSDASSKMVDSWADAGSQIIGFVSDSWNDSGTTPFTNHKIIPGLAAFSFAVLAPESVFPTNDTIEGAYRLPECPLSIVQCVFPARDEGGDILGLGASQSVWYKFTPATSETITFTTDSDFDPAMAIYASDGTTELYSDDDSGPFTEAQIAAAVTAGETYYIQIINKFTDNEGGYLKLTANCTGGFEPPPVETALIGWWS